MTFTFHRPKHPTKVHMWAGISSRVRIGICIFDVVMKSELFIEILEKMLLLFIDGVYPNGQKFMHDNDPKHASIMTKDWLHEHSINWWKTPTESPDLNPTFGMS